MLAADGDFFSFLGVCDGDEMCDMKDGDLVTYSLPSRWSPCVFDCQRRLGFKIDRSNLAGFFFLLVGPASVPSISSREWALLLGRPLAIAEFDVCCEMDSGTLERS